MVRDCDDGCTILDAEKYVSDFRALRNGLGYSQCAILKPYIGTLYAPLPNERLQNYHNGSLLTYCGNMMIVVLVFYEIALCYVKLNITLTKSFCQL